jgi:hypothetical protein
MLGQQFSLPILMPMALDVLEQEPFVASETYPGALLTAALRVDPKFWREHPRLWHRLNVVVADVESVVRLLETELLPAAQTFRELAPASQEPG